MDSGVKLVTSQFDDPEVPAELRRVVSLAILMADILLSWPFGMYPAQRREELVSWAEKTCEAPKKDSASDYLDWAMNHTKKEGSK